jgi:hypothetical protein
MLFVASAGLNHRVFRAWIDAQRQRFVTVHSSNRRIRPIRSWQTFLRAHWGAIAGADFFRTEVWTWQGLVTYYTVFVIDLASRRVHVLGSTPHPTERFMGQMVRLVTAAEEGVLIGPRVLICDRDRKRKSVSIKLFPPASGTSDTRSPSSSSTTISNAITRDSTTG